MKYVIILALFIVSGCASSPHYNHASADQDQFVKDRYECMKEVPPGNCSMFKSCLATKGYTEDSDGPLEVPKDMEFTCSRNHPNIGQAIGQGFQTMGQSMQNAPKTINCHSYQIGNMTNTQCN